MIGLIFGGAFKWVASVIANVPAKLWYALAILAALMFAHHLHSGWEKSASNAAFNKGFNVEWKREQTEEAKNRIQRISIDKLQAALDDQSRAVTQLAAESDTRTKAAQQALQAAQEAARASDGTARALDASAAVARADAGKCAPSDEFWNVARKDL